MSEKKGNIASPTGSPFSGYLASNTMLKALLQSSNTANVLQKVLATAKSDNFINLNRSSGPFDGASLSHLIFN